MTDAELAEFLARSARGQAAAEAVRQLVESRPDYTIHGIDNATGGAFVGITGDTAALQAELDGAIGPGTVTVVGMTRTDDELRELSDQVGAYLERARQRSVGLGAGNRLGRLYVFLEILDPVLISELAAAFPDDVEAMCVEGADPADVVPDGPQPQQGDDWRLLADTPGVGAPYDTGFAGDAAGYEALWAEIGLPGEPPAVDFDTEAVIWFGPA